MAKLRITQVRSQIAQGTAVALGLPDLGPDLRYPQLGH